MWSGRYRSISKLSSGSRSCSLDCHSHHFCRFKPYRNVEAIGNRNSREPTKIMISLVEGPVRPGFQAHCLSGAHQRHCRRLHRLVPWEVQQIVGQSSFERHRAGRVLFGLRVSDRRGLWSGPACLQPEHTGPMLVPPNLRPHTSILG